MPIKIIYPALQNYQRRWRNYKVDKNLKNDWLERLNSLKLFSPINVCEGHFTCEDQHPLIVLLAGNDWVDKLEQIIRSEYISEQLNKIVKIGTIFKLSHFFGVSNDPDDRFYGSRYFKLSLRRDDPRESLDFLEQDVRWFEDAVEAVEKIDLLLHKKITS